MVARMFAKLYEAEERLALLGIPSEVLQEAGRSGKRARASSTPFHPKWYAGNTMYCNALASLGQLLAQSGWRRDDPSGHPLVINRERKIALTVAASDSNTGNADLSKPPSTRPSKGPRTEEAVEENELLLFPDMFSMSDHRHPLDGYEFWWLLMYADDIKNELRLELSKGIRMSKERSIAGWSERVMLASQPLDEGGLPILEEPNDQGPQGGEYDVEVRRLE
jgi:hypothetical protein